LGNPVVELLRYCLRRQGDTLYSGQENCRLSSVLCKIAMSEEVAKQTVVVVMMSRFDVSDTLLTVVEDIDCLMMHMHRRQHHHWQISGQQYDRRNMSQQTVHLSGCKSTTFSSIRQSLFSSGAIFQQHNIFLSAALFFL
jgi:hypothetical protein